MKRSTGQNIVLGILLGVLAMAIPGCQGKELAVANQTYSRTVKYLDDQFDAGKINDTTWITVIAPAREAANAVRNEWNDAFIAGRPFDWRTAIANFYTAMAPLLRQSAALGGPTNGSAVSP